MVNYSLKCDQTSLDVDVRRKSDSCVCSLFNTCINLSTWDWGDWKKKKKFFWWIPQPLFCLMIQNAQLLYVTHVWPWCRRHFCPSIYDQVLGVLVFQSFECQVKPTTTARHICAYELFGNEIDSAPSLPAFQISREFFFVTLLTVVLFCAVRYIHLLNPLSNRLRWSNWIRVLFE